jgi:hypothetical protein
VQYRQRTCTISLEASKSFTDLENRRGKGRIDNELNFVITGYLPKYPESVWKLKVTVHLFHLLLPSRLGNPKEINYQLCKTDDSIFLHILFVGIQIFLFTHSAL